MKALLFCLVISLVLFTATEATRLKVKAKARTAAQALAPTVGRSCSYENDCYWTDIPGVGEEEICEVVQKCTDTYW